MRSPYSNWCVPGLEVPRSLYSTVTSPAAIPLHKRHITGQQPMNSRFFIIQRLRQSPEKKILVSILRTAATVNIHHLPPGYTLSPRISKRSFSLRCSCCSAVVFYFGITLISIVPYYHLIASSH